MKPLVIVAVAFVFGCFAVTALAATVLVGVAMMGSPYGERLAYESGEVYYTENVTESDAQRFADYMQEQWGELNNFVTFQLEREAATGIMHVRMCAKPQAWESDDLDYSFIALETLLQKDVFPGENVVFALCDDELETRKTIDEYPASSDAE